MTAQSALPHSPQGSALRDAAWGPAALLTAWKRMAPRLERHRFDAAALERLKANPRAFCGALYAHIQAGSYRPQPLQPVPLRKRGGGRRLLLVPPLADRLVQGALAQALSERIDLRFNDASYAYRPGRSVQRAIARVRHEMCGAGIRWILDADIRQCFDQIRHEPLLEALRRFGLWQDRTAWLLKQFLHSEVAPHRQAGASCLYRGLPQGSPLSPLFCNIVLDQLDRAFEKAAVPFVRYADDFVAFAASEGGANAACDLAQRTLGPLGLELHAHKTAVRALCQGFDFLGAHFDATPAGESPPPSQSLPVEVPTPLPPDTGPTQHPPVAAGRPAARQAQAPLPPPYCDGSEAMERSTGDPLLRTLYLLESRTSLMREGDALVVEVPDRDRLRVPIHTLHQVLAFGETSLSSGAIALCLQNAVPVMILSGRGRYFGVIDPLRVDNVDLQREQFRAIDDEEKCLRLAAGFVHGKVANSATMLRRWKRHRALPGGTEILDRLHRAQANAERAADAASLRGIEGAAAAAYWKALGEMLPRHWRFSGRKRQPATDPVNSMLSYGYTVLYYNVLTLIMARGLNPYLGFYHRRRSGHHSLASDLMEEFRAPVVDALVFDLAANGQLKLEDFSMPEAEAAPCLMSSAARRILIQALERKLNSTLQHPRFDVVMDYRRIIDGQVLQLVNVIRRQASSYLPFVLRS